MERRNKSLVMWRGDNPTNHFPNMMGENYKLGSGAQGLTSQSQQIMKAFRLDQKGKGGGGYREEDRRRRRRTVGEESWRRGDRCREERGGAGASQPHTQPTL